MKFNVFILMLIFLTPGCKIKSPISHSPEVSPLENFKEKTTLAINFSLTKNELESYLDKYLDETFVEPIELQNYGVKINISRFASLDISIEDKNLLFEIPLDIELKKNTFLGAVKAEGTALFVISSLLEVTPEWNLTTQSKLEYHQWIIKPVFDVGIDIPIQFISDHAIQKIKTAILKDIDDQLKENIQLKDLIDSGIDHISAPFQIHDDYNTWYKLRINEVGLSSLESDETRILGQLIVSTVNELHTKFPEDSKAETPTFRWYDSKIDSSSISIGFDLSNVFIQDQLNKIYKGIILEENGRSVTIDTLIVRTIDDRTLIKTRVHGDYNGWVEISGIPTFSDHTKSLIGKDIQVSIKTKNILVKGLSWLLKGKINRKLRSLTNIPLGEHVHFLQNEIDHNLNELNADKGIYVYANLGSYDIKHIELYQEGIVGVIYFKAYLSSHINSISNP